MKRKGADLVEATRFHCPGTKRTVIAAAWHNKSIITTEEAKLADLLASFPIVCDASHPSRRNSSWRETAGAANADTVLFCRGQANEAIAVAVKAGVHADEGMDHARVAVVVLVLGGVGRHDGG
mmetsp:Transcript_23796/g.39342  ORF Transcript_23796/g.39342 Transcript_23796/m.39342 type:complete len:123 (+) Transcript_23796:373-741(+)